MTKGIFVTATGTDVGKTFISALLVKKKSGRAVLTADITSLLSAGAEVINGELIPGDCAYVVQKPDYEESQRIMPLTYLKLPYPLILQQKLKGKVFQKKKSKQIFEKRKERI